MFAMLPNDDQAPFRNNPQLFVDINLEAAQMVGTRGTAFFANGFAPKLTNMSEKDSQRAANTLGAITRDDWLSDIPRRTDTLTRAFTGVDALESMGRLNRGEQVGKTHTFSVSANTTTEAPILELRRIIGRVGINNWKDLALDIFDFIVKFNDLKTQNFKSRRFNPTQQKQ